MTTWDKNGASASISGDGLTVASINHVSTVRATDFKTSGKWYWEIKVNTANAPLIGIIDSRIPLTSSSLNNNGVRYYYTDGKKWNTIGAYGASYTTGDTISVLLDLDNGNIEFWKNGVSQGIAYTDVLSMVNVYPAISDGGSAIGGSYRANFGASPFTYGLPNGYLPYGKVSKLALKNPTTNQHYSLSDNTLIHLPDNSTKNMILHGIEQGKEIQLDAPFDKHRHFNGNPVANASGKVFTQDIGKINTLSIREFVVNKDFEPIFKWYETKMTSNTSPTPLVVSAKGENSNTFQAWKSFNGTTANADDCWISGNEGFNSWVQIQYEKAYKMVSVKLTPRNSTDFNASSPKDFNILGSNNGIDFDTLAEIRGQNNWAINTSKQFSLSGYKDYSIYRIQTLSTNGSLGVAIGSIVFGYKKEVN